MCDKIVCLLCQFFWKLFLAWFLQNMSIKLAVVLQKEKKNSFSNFSCMLVLNPNNFLKFEFYLIVLIYKIWETSRNKLKKHFTVRKNCSSDLKIFANSRPSASDFKKNSRSQEHFFLTVGQNNFGNKIPLLHFDNFFPSCLC
jgi:hypothetical protein